jgi:hypothetical protein
MVRSYYRNGVKADGVWQYSLALCIEEFPEEFSSGIYAVSTNFKHLLKEFPRNWICGTKT